MENYVNPVILHNPFLKVEDVLVLQTCSGTEDVLVHGCHQSGIHDMRDGSSYGRNYRV